MTIKVLLLASTESPHTTKIAKALADLGNTVCILSLSHYDRKTYADYPEISIISLCFSKKQIKGNLVAKITYLKALPSIRKVIAEFKPDILHAHYASGYGLLGALCGFHPYVLSVWGSDIYYFPRTSWLHKRIINYALTKADSVLATSNALALETKKYTARCVQVTPFGVDTDLFKPAAVQSLFTPTDIVIGTIKTLEKIYGIDQLIRAFQLVKTWHPLLPLKLLIVGTGSQELYLKSLAQELGIWHDTVFTGYVAHDSIANYHNMLTISVAVSRSESFGVSVVESSACCKPVVVSNVGGLPEIVVDNVTGFIVEGQNIEEIARALEKLIIDEQLRTDMGMAGRERVKQNFTCKITARKFENIYETILDPKTI